MSRKRSDGDDPEPRSEFEKLMLDTPGVRRLPRRALDAARVAQRPARPARPTHGATASEPGRPDVVGPTDSRTTPIRVARSGDRIEGRADGVDMRQLKRLRRGEIPCDREIDLHGMTAAVAQGVVIEAILGARVAGERCVRVVHGRGQRSAGGRAVLRDALVDWLMDPRVARELLAVATDDSPGGGGPGATWLLLRRSRAG